MLRMKILSGFNTKLDEHELYDAIKKNGHWNAIMIKKHRFFLIRPIIWMIFAFMAFWLLIRFAYRQFYVSEYKRIFRFLTIAYSLVTCVRCIHSILMIIYDIKYQIHCKDWYIDTIDEKDFEDWRYEWFIKHSFVSMGLQVILMIFNSVASFVIDTNLTSNMVFNVVWVIVNIGFLFLLYKVLDRIIDYEMDFNIFSIDQFVLYRQHGFFKTESMNIATSTIKIVQESKGWFLWSLFNFWKISIHPEWDLWSETKAIQLFYVPQTKTLTKKLNDYISKSKELMNVKVAV